MTSSTLILRCHRYERHNPYSQWKEYLHFMRRQESTLWWTRDELIALHSPKILRDTLKVQHSVFKCPRGMTRMVQHALVSALSMATAC